MLLFFSGDMRVFFCLGGLVGGWAPRVGYMVTSGGKPSAIYN